jgi:pSer/pThr/pTyr-binding forkhead associated (FHA) protein
MSSETALYLRVSGRMVRIEGRSAVVGRSRSCDVHFDAPGISRRHAEVILREDGASIRDLGSTHGTWLNGLRLSGEVRLAAGAKVTLGEQGPSFELMNAIVRGSPVLGAAGEAGNEGAPVSPPRTAVMQTPPGGVPLDVAASTPAPFPNATGRSRFRSGLLWGTLVGLAVGAAAAVLL